jgi:hypothetical protein
MYLGYDASQTLQRDRQRRLEAQASKHRQLRASRNDLLAPRPPRPRRSPWLWLARASRGLTPSPSISNP